MNTQKKEVIAFLLALVAYSGFSQYVSPKMDLFGLISKEQNIIRPSIEYAFNRHFSAVIYYEHGKYNYSAPQEEEIKGWGIMPELRYYPLTRQRPAPIGFFIGAYYRYRNLVEQYTGEDYLLSSQNKPIFDNFSTKGAAYNCGIDFGYKVNVGPVALEVLLGFGGAGGKWKAPNERAHIDPVYKSDLRNFDQSSRLEISAALVFPKVKTGQVLMNDVPSSVTPRSYKSESATVIIYRKKRFLDFFISYDLYANDKPITDVTNGSYFIYTCAPGVVKFYGRTESANSITVNLEKGKTYYLKCSLDPGILIGQPGFKVMRPEKGERQSLRLANRQ